MTNRQPWEWLDQRPVVIAICGPNGAGKTTFYNAHIARAGLRFVNADLLANELGLDAYTAAQIAASVRRELVKQKESFVFETVLSDPVGEKVHFLRETANSGYTVVLCYIGVESADISEQRVSMRVSQGGHDVPTEKIMSRFPRTLANLKIAIGDLPHVLVFDNTDMADPFKLIGKFHNGIDHISECERPDWLADLLK